MGVRKFDFAVPLYNVDPSVVFRAPFLTELCLSECTFMSSTNDHDRDLFSGHLKRLSLNKVHMGNEMLEKIMRSCPLIEYLLLSGLKTIPVGSIFRAEFLAEFHLSGCKLITTSTSTDLLSIKCRRLKTLSLDKVYILEETLENIMRSCPMIERVLLSECTGLTTIPVAPNVSIFQAEFLTELHLRGCNLISTCTSTEPLVMKRLKTLSLDKVDIQEETLEKIMLSCPLIERVLLSECTGLTTIPVAPNVSIFQAEFLTELHLRGCNLISTSTSTEPLVMKRLKTLSLDKVDIQEETLEKIMLSCPSIERVLMSECRNLITIKSNEIHVPTIEPTYIVHCPNWYCNDKYFFPRLKSLHLGRVRLSAELFESFSSNFPSLKELELRHCHGFQEIQLTVCSIKRLIIILDSIMEIKATIYAANIHYLELSGHSPPQLTFYTENGREWKSHVVMLFHNRSESKVFPWLVQLSKLLNSLSESQISLDVSSYPLKHLKVKDTYDAGFCKPVPLEQVRVKGDYRSSSVPDLLNSLFLLCRPRYICMNWYIVNSRAYWKKRKNKLAEFIIFKIIANQGEMSRGYLWERDLEEISMQVWDEDSEGWHGVHAQETSFSRFTSSNPKIRFQVKWRD